MNPNHRASLLAGALLVAGLHGLQASSHREAPLITTTPKVDATDFYVFNSYEPGREDYVTLVAAYLPLQDAYGGPNYFTLDPEALYEIHLDNTGDAVEDLTFQFRFQNVSRNASLVIGPAGNQRTNAVPLLALGPITAADQGALGLDQRYTVNLVRGPRRSGTVSAVTNAVDGSAQFTKPQDYVGAKTFPDYDSYANQYIYPIALPGSDKTGRMFVGQRKDPFVVNLGETFDLVNISTSPLGPVDANKDSLRYKNVTALILELPKAWVTAAPDKPIIGAWTTASLPDGHGGWRQASRLSMPLVNEVVVGLKDKDGFNASEPASDGTNQQLVDYVTHPTLPAILELLFGGAGLKAPAAPRNDLVAVFATGIDGLNKNGSVAEMQRLNTAIPATPAAQQKNLGVLAGFKGGNLDATKADLAGFPNGRRPGDDVVDISLRVVMGAIIPGAVNADTPLTDGAYIDASFFAAAFPYLRSPVKGSPNDPTINILPQTATAVHGPYQPVPGTYNPATRTLTVPKPAGDAGYLRLETDGKVTLSGTTASATEISTQVK